MAEFKEEYKLPHEQEEPTQEMDIEIEDDRQEADRVATTTDTADDFSNDAELSSYSKEVQKRIKRMTRANHDERRAKEEALREREAAETFAKQVYEENKRLQQQLASGSKMYIEQSQSSAQGELENAKRKYKEAYEQGDVDAITEAQAEIAKATLRLDKTSDMRPIEVEEREFQPPQAEKPKLNQRTQRWVENNSDWWGVDEEMTASAMGLDRKLQKQYGPDYIGTEEYFKTIDKTMRRRFPEQFEDAQSQEEDEPPPKRTSEPDEDDESPRRAAKPAAVVAPATRSTSPNRIKLKASEAAIARRLGVPMEEYAKQVAKLRREI